MKKTSQDGIAHLGLVLLLVVAAVVAFSGYKVMQSRNNSTASTNQPVATQTVQTIKTATDLSSVESSLNSQNIDSDLNPSGFNQDVSNLL